MQRLRQGDGDINWPADAGWWWSCSQDDGCLTSWRIDDTTQLPLFLYKFKHVMERNVLDFWLQKHRHVNEYNDGER